jgi:hypothetical protein
MPSIEFIHIGDDAPERKTKVPISATVRSILPGHQANALLDQSRDPHTPTDERIDGWNQQINRIHAIGKSLPPIYSQDGTKDPIVHAHYFNSSCDWWITEANIKDQKAFGFVCMNGDTQMAELGYISIREFTCEQNYTPGRTPELDFHWKPVPLSQAKAERWPDAWAPDPAPTNIIPLPTEPARYHKAKSLLDTLS